MTLNPIKLFNNFTNWFSERLTPKAKIIIAIGALMFVIIMGFIAYKINDYFEHDPNACFACHVHDEANKQWAKSEHADINCHECHHSSKKDQVIQMYRFAFLGQRSIAPRHGEIIVPRVLCLRCHWDRDEKFPKAPDISKSRYHAKHVFIEKIECTKCHGYRTHKFSLEERYCLTCHKDEGFRPHGTTDKPHEKIPMGELPCLNSHTDRTSNLLPERKKCLFCHGDEKVRKELTKDATIDVKHFRPTDATVKKHLLGFDASEHPVAVQLAGHDPQRLAGAARIAEDLGYDEINLNVGCPSSRVQDGRFGACLMTDAPLVARCVAAMSAAVSVPVTVKTRNGVDDHDSYDFLAGFVREVAAAGCRTFVVHARKAILQGLSPRENRSVPPRCYPVVYRLKQEFAQLQVIINGGIGSLEEIGEQLSKTDGVMLGRKAAEDPYFLALVQEHFLGGSGPSGLPEREAIVHRMV